jgi:hypothetical protein
MAWFNNVSSLRGGSMMCGGKNTKIKTIWNQFLTKGFF